jgi:hypothetical protein
MDNALRYGLWNAIHLCIWDRIEYGGYRVTFKSSNVYHLFWAYWHDLFKLPIDNLPHDMNQAHQRVREYFFDCKWYEVYDLIEFTAQHCPDGSKYIFVEVC